MFVSSRCLSFVIVAASLLMSVPSRAATAEKPNIIFILSDDVAQGDLGCYGQKIIQTPNLDRMAAEGVRFTQAYCGTTVCAPSRTSLITGLHSGHSPIRANREVKPEGQMPLPADTVTVAQLLKTRGYATACAGKWGMGMFDTTGSPLAKGFDHFFGYNCQRHAHSYFPAYLYRNDQRFELPENAGNARKTYAQNLIQNDVLAWVREKKDEPFFLFYAITLPHGSFQIDDQGIYKDKPWSEQEKNYAAMVTRLDTDTGKLLDLLKELNIDQKTLVMFSGDNGSSFSPTSELGKRFNQSANGMRGFKRSLYEGGLRQAALALAGRDPGGQSPRRALGFLGLPPNLRRALGAEPSPTQKADGLSLVSFLKGGPAPEREYFYWELHEGAPIQAIRFGNWKAVRNGPGKPIELYDLKADSAEANNLAADNPDVVSKAQTLMQSARIEHPNWPLAAKRTTAPKAGKPGNPKPPAK